jgi:hypothetical protein
VGFASLYPPYKSISARRATSAYAPCANCPSCQSVAGDAFRFSEIALTQPPNQRHHPRRPALDQEGASRSSRTLSAGCDGRFGDAHGFVRTNGADADAKARGPGLPTLRSSSLGLRGSRAMGANKPGSQGERAISVKTIAQGMPDDLAEPAVPSPCFFYARGPWVVCRV